MHFKQKACVFVVVFLTPFHQAIIPSLHLRSPARVSKGVRVGDRWYVRVLEGELGEAGVSPGNFRGWVPAFTTRLANAWCLVEETFELFVSAINSDGTSVLRGDEVGRKSGGSEVRRVAWTDASV